MSAVTLQIDRGNLQHTPAALRSSCNELVGLMFGQMLKEARSSQLARGLTDSSASRVFGGQLDDVLVQSASRGDSGQGVFSAISAGLYRQLAPTLTNPASGKLNVKG
jgi:Rod binding domain-containing protein